MNPSRAQKSPKEYWRPTPYNQRHIATLKRVTQWTDEDLDQNRTHNRILQDGFLKRPAESVVHDAKITHTDWLTDFVCVKSEHALRMHIAARICCFYQVAPEDLDRITDLVYQKIEKEISVAEIDKEVESRCPFNTAPDEATLHTLKKHYPELTETDPNYQNILDAFLRIQHDKSMMNVTHEMIRERLDLFMPSLMESLGIEEKPMQAADQNVDHVFLGAAGSGKSTIARQKLDPSHTLTAAIIATDNYRAVSFGEIDSKLSNEQAFIKTQDTAYFIKELVQKNLEQATDRPALVIDVVTFEPWMTDFLQPDPQKTAVSVACLADASQVPLRAYQRATDPESAPADKGRHVNTHSLIEGHLRASKFLLTGLPANHPQIILYDTNTKDRIAQKIAEVDNVNHTVTVTDLSQMGAFLGKQNLNSESTSKSELYYDAQAAQRRFRYKIQHQAASLLSLIPKEGVKNEYQLVLQTKSGENYATIQTNAFGELEFKVTDRGLMKSELRRDDNPILPELVKQTSHYKDQVHYLGERLCQKKALEDLFSILSTEPNV